MVRQLLNVVHQAVQIPPRADLVVARVGSNQGVVCAHDIRTASHATLTEHPASVYVDYSVKPAAASDEAATRRFGCLDSTVGPRTSLGPGAHVHRACGQPQRVDADHRSHSRSQAAHSPAHCSGQLTVALEAPRRNSMRISVEVVATAACGSCTGKNSAPGLVATAARLPPPPSSVRPSWLNQR